MCFVDINYQGETAHEGGDINNTQQSCINPGYNIILKHHSIATNILLMKGQLKLHTKANAVRVAMSPSNLGGEYQSDPHFVPKEHVSILRETQSVNSNCARLGSSAWLQRCWSCGVFKSWTSVAHSPFQWNWNALYNYAILNKSVSFFKGVADVNK